jgi:hypothetical protein
LGWASSQQQSNTAIVKRSPTCPPHTDGGGATGSRITKAYGTLACKGDSIPERPHRLSEMFKPPAVIEPVANELLVALAAEAPKPEKKDSGVATTGKRGGWTAALVEEVLDKADVNRGDAMDYKGETKWQHDCLNNPDHRKPDAYTILDKDSYAHHHCSHNSCAELDDADWRRLWEEHTGDTYPFPNRRKQPKTNILILDDDTPVKESELGADANSWAQIADELDEVRRGKRTFENGDGKVEEEPLPRHIAEEHILQFVKDVFEKRGNGLFFFDAYPYVYLPEEKQVVRFQDDAEAHQLLAKMRLRIKQRDTELVRENLRAHIMEFGEQTRVEKLGCLRGGTIYVNNGRGGIFKITTDSISEIANGTDGVLMHAPDLKPFPALDETKLEEISKKLIGVGGMVTDSLLCQHLNAHFEEGGSLAQSQYQGFLTSLDFLKAILAVAKDVVEAEKGVSREEERNHAEEALTELFSEAKTRNTHIIVERIVGDIDEIVKKVRFPDWQHTSQGERLVQKELRRTLLKYKLHTDQELFDKAYEYIRQYY